MQEQIKITLNEAFLSAEPTAQTLFEELVQHSDKITELLTGYHFQSRGRVFNVAVNQDSVQLISTQMARFVVTYTIGQFNACADVDFTEKASMEMLVDIKDGIITGEYIPEREPDEF